MGEWLGILTGDRTATSTVAHVGAILDPAAPAWRPALVEEELAKIVFEYGGTSVRFAGGSIRIFRDRA